MVTAKQAQNTRERTMLGMVCGEQRRLMHIQAECSRLWPKVPSNQEFSIAQLEALEIKIREQIALRAPKGEIAKKLKEFKERKARERTAL